MVYLRNETLNEVPNTKFANLVTSPYAVHLLQVRRKKKPLKWNFEQGLWQSLVSIPWIENPAFSCCSFFFSKIKNAVNWTVEPGQDPLNLVRIGYIDIKRYFRAMYLHK
jgi:hypothetical protein